MTLIADDEIAWLHLVRDHELSRALPYFPAGKATRILEIGSGTGYMLGRIKQSFPAAVGLEVQGSAYQSADTSIKMYDGKTIPYPESSFDVVFSSHVLEHIPDKFSFFKEVKRVLKEDGLSIHILPSPTWRLLTSVMHYPALLKIGATLGRHGTAELKRHSVRKKRDLIKFVFYAPRHGETGNFLTEVYYFSCRRWIELFESAGFEVTASEGTGIVYWGRDIFRRALPVEYRKRLSKLIGSSSNLYVARNKSGFAVDSTRRNT